MRCISGAEGVNYLSSAKTVSLDLAPALPGGGLLLRAVYWPCSHPAVLRGGGKAVVSIKWAATQPPSARMLRSSLWPISRTSATERQCLTLDLQGQV